MAKINWTWGNHQKRYCQNCLRHLCYCSTALRNRNSHDTNMWLTLCYGPSRQYTAEILWLSIILVLICGTCFIIDVHYTYFQKEELSVTQNIVNICNKTMNVQANDDIGCIQLVYGLPGVSQGLSIFPPDTKNNCLCNVLPWQMKYLHPNLEWHL